MRLPIPQKHVLLLQQLDGAIAKAIYRTVKTETILPVARCEREQSNIVVTATIRC